MSPTAAFAQLALLCLLVALTSAQFPRQASNQQPQADEADTRAEQLQRDFRESVAQAVRSSQSKNNRVAPIPVARQIKPAPPQPATHIHPKASAHIPAPPPPPETAPAPTKKTATPKSLPSKSDIEEQHKQQELFQKQAESAHYSFDTSVDDGIMGHSHIRQEVRDGLKLSGAYSYSDGFYRRTVQYEADENGYRIVKEEVEPIGDGPELDLQGTAKVQTNIGGINNQYVISASDIHELTEKHQTHSS